MMFVGTGQRLTPEDLAAAAALLGVDVATIRAIIEVESAGAGFGTANRPIILFEPHVFFRELKDPNQQLRAVMAGLAYPKWGEKAYPRGQQARYVQLVDAVTINETAAFRSTSWGLGQIMGFNHRAAGYPTVQDLVRGALASEGEQLLAMCRFIVSKRLEGPLQRQDWSEFAYGYNGPSFATHRYHLKLEQAHRKYAEQKETRMASASAPWPPSMDQDAVHFANWLRTKYPTGVDHLGWVRWSSDYRVHRANGVPHADALVRIGTNIDEIRSGRPVTPWPDGQFSVPWPPNMDAEAKLFGDALEKLYREHQQRDVDETGWTRWSSDFRVHRANGLSPEAAAKKVKNDILKIWGITPEPEPGPPPGSFKIVGPLLPKSLGFTDGQGRPVTSVFCHFGEAHSAFIHCSEGNHASGFSLADWESQMQEIAKHYPGIRSWNVLGYYDGAWQGREVTPFPFVSKAGRQITATPNYYGRYVDFYVRAEHHGLMVMDDRGDLNAWDDGMRTNHMREMGRTLNGAFGQERALKLMAGLWACNEAAHNGLNDPQQAVRMLNAFKEGATWWPAVRGLSDYDQTEEPVSLKAWSIDPATCVTCHPLRDVGNLKRMLEHHFSNGYGTAPTIDKPMWYTEPTGPGDDVTVGATSDVEFLCALAMVSTIGGSLWTYMSSPGVFWKSRIDQQPGFAEVPAAVARLYPDVMMFGTRAHSGSRFANVRPLVADDAKQSRFDFALASDGRFSGLAYAEHGVVEMEVARRFRADIIHPQTLEVVWSGEASPGQKLPLSGRIARLVQGQVL